MSSRKRPNDGSPPVTPQRKHKSLRAAHHPHTPFNKKSNIHSIHTQDMNTNQILQQQREQQKLIELLGEEFKGATYEGDWVGDHYCPAPVETVDAVMARLRKDSIWLPSVANDFSVGSLRKWPKARDASETLFYPPFTALLNGITKAFKNLYPDKYKSSYYSHIKFFGYDKLMYECVSGESVLRPDFLGLDDDHDADERASWYDTILVGEVKTTWAKLVLQAGTYARCLFAATDHRIFIPVLVLRQSTAEFRLCFFHRSGMLATHSMKLRTEPGLRGLVSTIVGMWLWQTPSQAGYEPTQVPKYFSFNDTKYHIHRVLCRRQAIRGRATTVYVVDRDEVPDETTRYLAPAQALGSNHWTCLNPFDRYEPPAQPHTVDDEYDNEAEEEESIPTRHTTSKLPNTFIVKCSYQLVNRESEVDVFKSVEGYIGIPDILEAYQATDFEIPAGKIPTPWRLVLKPDVPKRVETDSNASGGEESEPSDEIEPTLVDDEIDLLGLHDCPLLPYESRVHRHIIIASIGARLTHDLTFRQVGFAMLHAMIGHCALFTEGRYVHRDVSHGNIVFLLQANRSEWKCPPILDNIITNKDCTAVLIDGDVAKKWGTLAQSSDRSVC
ncbi:hypothetical protein HGRIS_000382 [Hohenbuehelia grisea]|uniref:Fungal-type protein kinase domain-containing protein n=1 Tax=Hohenbuehelia grisea TaxID=104357 RepID=A0ABR3JRH9_9AGAR